MGSLFFVGERVADNPVLPPIDLEIAVESVADKEPMQLTACRSGLQPGDAVRFIEICREMDRRMMEDLTSKSPSFKTEADAVEAITAWTRDIWPGFPSAKFVALYRRLGVKGAAQASWTAVKDAAKAEVLEK